MKLDLAEGAFCRNALAAHRGTQLLRLLCAVLLAVVSSSLVNAQKKKAIGIVRELRGSWVLDGKKIEELALVPAGGIVKPALPQKVEYSRISIEVWGISAFMKAACDKSGSSCSPPMIELPASPVAPEAESKQEDREKRSANRTFRHPLKYEPLCSGCQGRLRPVCNTCPGGAAGSVAPDREGRSANRPFRDPLVYEPLQSGVVKLGKDGLDLRPVFEDVERQSFRFSLELIEQREKADKSTELEAVNFIWDPLNPQPLVLSDLKQGLYRMVFSQPNTKEHEPTRDVWILVANAEKFEKIWQSFQSAVRITDHWPDDLEPDPESFLRAYLEVLAEENRI